MTMPSMTSSSEALGHNVFASLDLVEVKPGVKFSRALLREMLPDTETALFFGKVYELDYRQLSNLLRIVLDSEVATALLNEGESHSHDLQGYLGDMLDWCPTVEKGDVKFDEDAAPPQGEILPELWASLEVEVATSIKAVAEKLESVVHAMPGKQGEMVFRSLMTMNAKRPTIGDYRAGIHHPPKPDNLVILDVSGSVTRRTVELLVDDVVAMSYMANAHLAIVSDTCTTWEPGTYDSASVLDAAQFGGTHYEQLAPLFDRDWGVVVTIADYDSFSDARAAIAGRPGRIEELLDVSLVNRATFLAECVGQLAHRVRPLLVASDGVGMLNA